MKKFIILFSVLTLVTASLSFFIPLKEASDVYDSLIRLHVIADSDSPEEQELKLLVRDRILKETQALLEDAETFEDAKSTLEGSLGSLAECSAQTVAENGFDHTVSASLTVEYYPTKEYGDITLPAGEYNSLRITIGEGEGQNWWCVLFPPVCTGSASASEELAETGFTTDQIRLITDSEEGKYTVRFKCLEYFSDIKHKIKGIFS